MKGFAEIVPQRCILLFDPKEFEVCLKFINLNKKIKQFVILFYDLVVVKWPW